MSQHRETAAFQQSSPDSSKGGADSYNHEGTPDTRLTAFSPEENSAKSSKLVKSINLGASDTQTGQFPASQGSHAFLTAGLHHLDKDPFVTSTTVSKPEQQKLSATASAFRPYSSSPVVARGSSEVAPATNDDFDFDGPQQILSIFASLSTELHLSRCVVVSSPSQVITAADAEIYISKLEHLGSPCNGGKQLYTKGHRAYLRFTNIRDAWMVHRNIQLGGVDWNANFVSPPEFVQIVTPGSRLATPHEGQLSLLALTRHGNNVDATLVELTVRQMLQSKGDLFAFQKQASFDDGTLRAVVEFSDTNTALDVVSKYNGHVVDGIHLVLSFYKADGLAGQVEPPEILTTPIATPLRGQLPDLTTAFQGMTLVKTPQPSHAGLLTPGTQTPPSAGLHHIHPQLAMYPVVYRNHYTPATPLVFDHFPTRSHSVSSIASASTSLGHLYPQASATTPVLPVANEFTNARCFQPYSRPDNRRQNAMRVSRSPYYNAAGHHNHVDVNRIREGIDVRTTIMLRNIPNKVDQSMLKTIIDESSWGKYDFMYLRIDFANDCNVGYAFINFVDPLDIIDFVNARGNQRWNCFKSDKVAEISYATIQGKDCLVQKFRNSSVMLEAPHYRPKLYYTSNGPVPELSGQEEPFPEPDNQSKMKRSCENAEHVGLFTPNAGQHFRDEQRRRRSQYDRGTRLAALEEYDYETAIQQLYVPQ